LVDVTDGGKLLFNRTPAVAGTAAICSASLMRRGTEMISRSKKTRYITVIMVKYGFSLNIHKECVYLLTWDTYSRQSNFVCLQFNFVCWHRQWSRVLRMSRTRKHTCLTCLHFILPGSYKNRSYESTFEIFSSMKFRSLC